MNVRNLKADAMLLLTAIIWGTAFTAQRAGMEDIGPFTYTGLRFMLGALVILPLAMRRERRPPLRPLTDRQTIGVGLFAGLILFIASALQQVGLVHTTAGKAGFITGLYVVLVPLLGLFIGQRTHAGVWLGAALAVVGLYLLSINEALVMAYGDVLQLIGSVFWALHVIVVSGWAARCHSVRLALIQFIVCGVLSLLIAPFIESISLDSIIAAGIPIIYGGLVSVGLGYTIQVIAQRDAVASHAAIILSLEAVVAVLAGWLILGETLSNRAIIGCALMLIGMLLAQLAPMLGRRHL